MGSEALVAHIEQRTGCHVDAHRHAPAGGVSAAPHEGGAVGVESVYCLGLCAVSPAMMVNGKLVARVTPAKFDAALDSALRDATHDEQPHAVKELA
jgi:formate dehydrogenase subunit gamma